MSRYLFLTRATGVAAALLLAGMARANQLQGDPTRGQALYGVCMSCHSLDDNDVGPKHRGVVGRRAGTVPGYHYSAALMNSGLVWTPANLDRWLSGPQAVVPGAKMFFSLSDAQKRADIIAYLAKEK
jgi:cytochrome c